VLLKIEDSSSGYCYHSRTAFGGGLELAMAGHYRVCSFHDQVGQPEVKLGLIPGGGHAAPSEARRRRKAVEMLRRNPVKAEKREVRIVDRLIEDDLLAGAVAFAASRW